MLRKQIWHLRARGKNFLDSNIAKYSQNSLLRNDVQEMTNHFLLFYSFIKFGMLPFSTHSFWVKAHLIRQSSSHNRRFRGSPFMCHFLSRWLRAGRDLYLSGKVEAFTLSKCVLLRFWKIKEDSKIETLRRMWLLIRLKYQFEIVS